MSVIIDDLVKQFAQEKQAGNVQVAQVLGEQGCSDDGFVEILPRHPGTGGKYAQYAKKPVIIIATNKDILLSPFVFDALGRPDFVKIIEDKRGHRFGLRAGSRGNGFKVGFNGSSKNESTSMRRIAAVDFVKGHDLLFHGQSSVYSATIIGNDVVASFDQKPELV